MSTSQQVSIINQAFANGLRHTLREKLHATYIYYLRRCSLPGRSSTGDIDLYVILKSELMDSERSELKMLHESLAEQFSPLGGELIRSWMACCRLWLMASSTL